MIPYLRHMCFFPHIVIISKRDNLDSALVLQSSVGCSYLHPWPYFQSLCATVSPSPQEFFMSHHLSCHIRFLPQAFLEGKRKCTFRANYSLLIKSVCMAWGDFFLSLPLESLMHEPLTHRAAHTDAVYLRKKEGSENWKPEMRLNRKITKKNAKRNLGTK